jgi:hypothetical protein
MFGWGLAGRKTIRVIRKKMTTKAEESDNAPQYAFYPDTTPRFALIQDNEPLKKQEIHYSRLEQVEIAPVIGLLLRQLMV